MASTPPNPTNGLARQPLTRPPKASVGFEPNRKHYFILSKAGKPIYSRYGDEESISSYMGVVQAIVSVFEEDNDMVRSIQAQGHSIAFLTRGPLHFVAVSPFGESERRLREQLLQFHYLMLSILTPAQLSKLFAQRVNLDLRRLLSGTEVMFDALGKDLESSMDYLLSSVQCLRIPLETRALLGKLLESMACKAVRHALLFHEDKIVTLLRPKRQPLHPADIHILMNMLRSSSSHRAAETWAPVCLPRYSPNGFLNVYTATLPHFPLTLVLVSEERESFHELSRWKETLGSRLRSKPLGPLLKETFRLNHYSIADVGFPGLRHFVFKSKSSLQYTSPTIQKEVGVEGEDATFYYRHYQDLQDRLYARGTPSTLHYHGCKRQITFGWSSSAFELYATFGPFVSKASVVGTVNGLVRWIQRQEQDVFMTTWPSY
ncbi:MAG: vacuolar fusion protein MON1 [Piptocephalis tieghemiana]|nr:MAG: vacuolar fusion protein MON1 [Piptocephalis tieghemiana]